MKVGFTGTQQGMTIEQKRKLAKLIDGYKNGKAIIQEFHHGDCVGADEEADFIALSIMIPRVVHPPIEEKKRAFCRGGDIIFRVTKPYLERNHDIVDETDCLIATPKEDVEQLRSGTWATIRYARKKHKPVFIILPNGKIVVQK